MKVAVLSESEADEAAIRVLVSGLLGKETEAPPMPPRRRRGITAVFRDVPTVVRHLHYRTDAEGVVVVVDSNRSLIHRKEHDEAGGAHEKCRLCQLRRVVGDTQKQLRPWERRGPLNVALGLAVPEIEAWYLVGRDPHVSEAAWIVGLQSGKFPYTKNSLRQSVYGTDRPSVELATACAAREAQRIVNQGKLDSLEKLFPAGFGALANDVRNW